MKVKRLSSLHTKAEAAMKEAVKEVIERHKKTGRPVSIWKNNKVALVSPEKIADKK